MLENKKLKLQMYNVYVHKIKNVTKIWRR